jgi:hypothetical protein
MITSGELSALGILQRAGFVIADPPKGDAYLMRERVGVRETISIIHRDDELTLPRPIIFTRYRIDDDKLLSVQHYATLMECFRKVTL